jgi:exosortase/archaeosortase family protein
MVITLFAWFIMKWGSVRSLSSRGRRWEVALGVGLIAFDYGENTYFQSQFGLIDMLVVFSAVAVALFGIRSFRLFWVPATYGLVLLLGYQLENNIPNYVALQDWMANLMVSALNVLGIAARASGHIVALGSGPNPQLLNVESDCTGIQGVLAFGMLSTMALLDTKPKASRVIPLFALGFIGVFLVNILRLLLVFLTFEFLGVDIGTEVHVYAGYVLFIAWILIFWELTFRYMSPRTGAVDASVALGAGGPKPVAP